MKIRKIALLGLGLLALSVAPVMASDYEGEYESEYELEYEDGYVSASGDASVVVAYDEDYDDSYDDMYEYNEYKREYRYEHAYNYTNESMEEYKYQHEERYEYQYNNSMAGAGGEEVHILITADGKPVKAIAYVVVDGIVQEVDVGASISVEADGELYIAAVGYPITKVDLSAIEGNVKIDLSTGEVVVIESNATQQGQQEPGPKGPAERGYANGSMNESNTSGAGYAYREEVKTMSQEQVRMLIQQMFQAKGEEAKVAEVKVKAENGHKVYVAVVKKPLRIGPIVLPFEITEEVEIPEEEVEAEAYAEGSVEVS